MTRLDYHLGFCVELSSTVAVVLATYFNMPVSSTHCQVGSIVFIGWVASGKGGVAWGLFGKIALSWVLTLPFAGVLAAPESP